MKVSAPSEPTPPPVEPAPAMPAAPAVASWPAWHATVDRTLVAFVLIAALLAALFISRNSDVWRHLGTGRLLVQGKYLPGSDPLSFTGEARAWVNQNLLYDALAYAIYSADGTGKALVAVKAITFATVFVILFRLRRHGASLWPWCFFAALGVLAAAPQTTLRPQVFGMLFLAIALFMLFASERITPRWKKPLLYGGIVALWTNVDASAFLGPLLVLLLLIGEWLQKRFFESEEVAETLPLPPLDSLLRTLPLALAGWLLNPAFIIALFKNPGDALGQLFPTELTFGYRALVAGDRELERTLSLSAFVGDYYNAEAFGYNVNGFAFFALLVLSGLLLGLGFAKVRISHILVWIGFALLPLSHYRWIPFFAITAVPIAAGYFNALGSHVRLGPPDDQRSKLLILTGGIARIFSVVAVLTLVLAAFPGWLHPKTNDDPAYARRVDWGIEADTGAKRACERIAEWRRSGELPGDVRLLTALPDFGDHCAWFAPGEKVFADTRFQFHRDELPDLIAMRKLLLREQPANDQSVGELRTLADKYRAAGIALARRAPRIDNAILIRTVTGFGTWIERNGFRNIQSPGRIWALDGRTLIVGRTDTPEFAAISKTLAYDASRAAFGPRVTAVPDGSPEKMSAPLPEGLIGEFFARPQPGASETDDAVLFAERGFQETTYADGDWGEAFRFGSGALAGGGVFKRSENFQLNRNQRPPNDDELALEMLALRGARTGVAKNPDEPAAYRALALAFQSRYAGLAQPNESTLIPFTAYTRAMARYPAPDQPRGRHTRLAIDDGLQLFITHIKLQQIDLALREINGVLLRLETAKPEDAPPPLFIANCVQTFMQNARVRISLLEANEKPESLMTKSPDWVRKKIETMRDETKKLFAQRNDAFTQRVKNSQPGNDPFAVGKLTLAEQFLWACEMGMPQKALDLVPENMAEIKPTEYAVRFKPLEAQNMRYFAERYRLLLTPNRPSTDVDLRLQAISLLLQTGQAETAAEQMKALDAWLDEQNATHPNEPNIAYWREALAGLRTELDRIVGNYTRSGEYLRESIRKLPKASSEELAAALAMIERRSQFNPAACGALLGMPAVAVGSPALLAWAERTNKAAAVMQNLGSESLLFFELALGELQSGHIAESRDSFGKSLKPQGLSLEGRVIFPDDLQRMLAERYLKLIDKYAGTLP